MVDMLASLADVKSWLDIKTTDNDVLLNRLIQQAGVFIANTTGRDSFYKSTEQDVQNGDGSACIMIENAPVQSVQSVYLNGVIVPASPAIPAAQNGWTLEPWSGFSPGNRQTLSLSNARFCKGFNNVIINYLAGFFVAGEAYTIPATPYQITVQPKRGAWGRDDGLTINGVAGIPVANGTTPTTGQYSVLSGLYTFAAADAGKAVALDYSYCPMDLNNCCIEIVGERFRYRSRIGNQSHSAAGQVTTSFNLAAMPDYVKQVLESYKWRAIIY